MIQLPYDITSADSIYEYSRGLSGKTLAEAIDFKLERFENVKNKGDLGTMVERYYFQYEPNSSHDADFKEAGVELKTAGVKKRSDGQYVIKERLVLSMINYMTVVDEDWPSSSMLAKSRLMLILFYLYEKGIPVFNRRFVLSPLLFSIPMNDLAVIRRDWEFIRDKIKSGKAHELSEGDTYYLGACRKGAGGANEKLRKQPSPGPDAKARAFSLKPNYMNRILSGYIDEKGMFDSDVVIQQGIEQATYAKFDEYIGKSVDDIADEQFFFKQGKNDKGYYRNLTMRMLGGAKQVNTELDKAGIELKTIRVDENWKPAEAMSFPNFKYMEIINQNWEESSFFEKIEQKFLFVIFKYDQLGILRLAKVKYWNMPYRDRLEARKVWEETKRRVLHDPSDLPKSKESPVAHVRPKGKNALDTIPTPQGGMLQKKCFWLNREYVASQLAG